MRSYVLAHYYTTPSTLEKLSLLIKIKQKDLETCIAHAPASVCFVHKKGHGHCRFPSRIMILRLKRVNSSTRLSHYLVNSSFSNMIDHEATQVLCGYFPKCLPDKDILLNLLSHSGKGLLKTIKSKHARIISRTAIAVHNRNRLKILSKSLIECMQSVLQNPPNPFKLQ